MVDIILIIMVYVLSMWFGLLQSTEGALLFMLKPS